MSAENVVDALSLVKADVAADAVDFKREVAWRLPAILEGATGSEIRQHLGPFLEAVFRDWAERETLEVRQRLEALATEHAGIPAGEPSPAVGPRLAPPAFEVSTFAVDAGVVAALALGIGVLFANALVGGLFLLAAPTLAAVGQGRGERALRKRAAETANLALADAIAKLIAELDRSVDAFALRIAPGAPLPLYAAP